MIKKLLEIKHWQLFSLLVLAPLLVQSFLFITLFDILNLPLFFSLTTKLMFPFTILIYAWLWSMGIFLNKRLSVDTKMKIGVFKACMLISLSCQIFLSFFAGTKFITDPESKIAKMVILSGIICFVCILYCINFNTRALKTIEDREWVEQGGSVRFNDYRNEFILLLIFPVGLWLFQPRLNKLIKRSNSQREQ